MKQEGIVLATKFVEAIPEKLEEHALYISMNYATVAHKCCCGCGEEVITPLSPTDWKLTYDGEGVTIHPSIGNWSFICGSHYWIDGSTVRWAEHWSEERITNGRVHDRLVKAGYYGRGAINNGDRIHSSPESPADSGCGYQKFGLIEPALCKLR